LLTFFLQYYKNENILLEPEYCFGAFKKYCSYRHMKKTYSFNRLSVYSSVVSVTHMALPPVLHLVRLELYPCGH
jgi:hypothetical protein